MKSSQEKSKKRIEQRVKSAVDAMNAIGIPQKVTRSALKRILKAYDDNWEYIEEENYRLLADSIFESQGEELKNRDEVDDDGHDKKIDMDHHGISRKKPETEIVGTGSRVEESKKKKHNDAEELKRKRESDMSNGASNKKRPGKEIVPMPSGVLSVTHESSKTVQIASLVMGGVNLSLNCSSSVLDARGFHMPNAEEVCKLVEDRYLSSAKKHEPHLSFMNLLEGMCDCVLELGSAIPKKDPEHKIVPKRENNGNGSSKKETKPMASESPSANSHSLVVFQPQQFPVLDDVKRVVNPRDITNGHERYRIPLVNFDDASYDFPSFHYIQHNVIYQNASIHISLARIGDEYCCSDCYGDCLKASIPCACARETGGDYAYTSEGLLKESYLDSFISKYRHTQERHLHYCQICPLERIKNAAKPGKCRGHLITPFIKECWTKCGCRKQCGNRVVQRGIRCHLEVFYSGKKKGWGLRCTEELARGTFICEYAGEILTNMELYERTVRASRDEKHTYPVTLDADWASEGILEDEDALCLDATRYGNVARFMNHRCGDPNLVEIPVEIETPDHHYYHIAFFTTRKIEPYEELCWDYGIDFNDHDHPVKAFKCACGSKLCRDRTNSKAKSTALVQR